ncbi:MAG TPA: sigma 54 modulation/S30EA ribosomal C-terminal domain-containing protein [Acidimicrobiales bacterium]|nr:sigma 54 modulation/S30EA ribosomal C-terminal domain-containing protein [Acidimicrobiales bacterium]
MPDGVIRWFDAKAGEAEIARGGHVFPARADAIEPVARRAGARVHFDIERTNGTERAVDVRLRTGTRVSHRQHRFGTLVGARQADMKGPAPHASVHPQLREPAVHPLEVARSWATSVARGDIPAALALYASDATLHDGEQRLTGRTALEGWLEANPLLGSSRHAQVRGAGEETLISWEPSGAEEPGLELRCRIAHGEIAEQWVSEAAAPAGQTTAEAGGGIQLAVFTKGGVAAADRATAEEAVRQIIDRLREPVLFARLKLFHEPDPARPRPAVAQAVLDVDGDLVRAQVAAPTMPEATNALVRRLHDRLEHRARHREYLHGSDAVAEPGEWRHGDRPTARPPYFDRPVEERELVRHKTFAVGELTPDEAAFDMEQLDYDFYLFSDLATGSDALIERVGDGSYRLTRSTASDLEPGPTAVRLEVSATEVPVLGVHDAMERLDSGAEPHLFYVDAVTGRANVLYRRYDGHYGLIAPE